MASLTVTRKSIDTGSYLVHVYRNAGDAHGSLAGTVERLGNGERKAFHSAAELLQLLSLGDGVGGEGTLNRNRD